MKRLIRSNEDIFAIANLYPKRTGINNMLWVDNLGSARNIEHNVPRLKVQNVPGDKVVDDAFVMSISKSPEILAGECKLKSKALRDVKNYIIEHYDDLIAHWNQDIDEDELKERLYIH